MHDRRAFWQQHRWLVVAYIAVMLAVGVYYVGVKGERRSAFNRWKPVVLGLVDGRDIYRESAFPTPPIMALVLYPFSLLPGVSAMAAWFAFKAVLTLVAFLWLLHMAWPSEQRPPLWIGVAVFGLSAGPVVADLLHGNVNLWIFFLIVASARLFVHGRQACSGVVLALAVACKLTPALAAAYFLYKRQWRIVAGCAAGLLLWCIIVPGLALGPRRNLELLQSWYTVMVRPYLVEGQVDTEHINQSLPGLVYRWTTFSVAIKPDDGRPPIAVNLWNLSKSDARRLLSVVLAMVVAFLAWHCRDPIAPDRRLVFLHQLSLALIAALLISERSWKHHYVTLAVPYAALLASLPRTNGVWLKGLLSVSVVLMLSTKKDLLAPAFGPDASKWMEAGGAYVWSAVALAVGHVVCLSQSRAATCTEPPSRAAAVVFAGY